MPGSCPSFKIESLWQIPQACTLIRTVAGPGSGIGRSTISNSPFARAICATRIVAMIESPVSKTFLRRNHAHYYTATTILPNLLIG
jgi:hypothetical protein